MKRFEILAVFCVGGGFGLSLAGLVGDDGVAAARLALALIGLLSYIAANGAFDRWRRDRAEELPPRA